MTRAIDCPGRPYPHSLEATRIQPFKILAASDGQPPLPPCTDSWWALWLDLVLRDNQTSQSIRWHLSPTCGCATHQKRKYRLIESWAWPFATSPQERAQAGSRLFDWTWEFWWQPTTSLGQMIWKPPSHHRWSRGRSPYREDRLARSLRVLERCWSLQANSRRTSYLLGALLWPTFKCGEAGRSWYNR